MLNLPGLERMTQPDPAIATASRRAREQAERHHRERAAEGRAMTRLAALSLLVSAAALIVSVVAIFT